MVTRGPKRLHQPTKTRISNFRNPRKESSESKSPWGTAAQKSGLLFLNQNLYASNLCRQPVLIQASAQDRTSLITGEMHGALPGPAIVSEGSLETGNSVVRPERLSGSQSPVDLVSVQICVVQPSCIGKVSVDRNQYKSPLGSPSPRDQNDGTAGCRSHAAPTQISHNSLNV
jgi:hypothetical protein